MTRLAGNLRLQWPQFQHAILAHAISQFRKHTEKFRMNWRFLLLIIVGIFLCAGCQTSSTSPSTNGSSSVGRAATATPDEFAATRATFEKDCSQCHQKNGDGGPVKLEDGTKLKVPSLRTGHALNHPDSDFVKQITKGGDGMPAFKDKLSSKEVDDLVRFIRHDFQGGQTPPAAQPSMEMKKK
jgi:mono/diheme cytochrome c family protein